MLNYLLIVFKKIIILIFNVNYTIDYKENKTQISL